MGLAVQYADLHVDVGDQGTNLIFASALLYPFADIIEMTPKRKRWRQGGDLFTPEFLLDPPICVRRKIEAFQRFAVTRKIVERAVLHTFADLSFHKRFPLDPGRLALSHEISRGFVTSRSFHRPICKRKSTPATACPNHPA